MWRNNPVNSIDPSGELITRISGASGNWGIVIDRSCNTYKHFIELALEDLQRRIPKCVKPGRLKDCLNEITFTIKCKRCNAAGYTRVPFVRDTIGLCIPHAFTGENGPLGAIILHEMVHLLERNHNKRFWAYMDKFMPQWRLYKDELNNSSCR